MDMAHILNRGMAEYATAVDIDVRYRDIDSVGHVNNAVFVSYLEHARVEYIQAVLALSAVDPGFVLVNVEVNFEREILLGQDVVVGLRVSDIGTSSITMDYEITADGKRAATAKSVIVPYDEDAGESRPVPDEWRERIASHEGTTF